MQSAKVGNEEKSKNLQLHSANRIATARATTTFSKLHARNGWPDATQHNRAIDRVDLITIHPHGSAYKAPPE